MNIISSCILDSNRLSFILNFYLYLFLYFLFNKTFYRILFWSQFVKGTNNWPICDFLFVIIAASIFAITLLSYARLNFYFFSLIYSKKTIFFFIHDYYYYFLRPYGSTIGSCSSIKFIGYRHFKCSNCGHAIICCRAVYYSFSHFQIAENLRSNGCKVFCVFISGSFLHLFILVLSNSIRCQA